MHPSFSTVYQYHVHVLSLENERICYWEGGTEEVNQNTHHKDKQRKRIRILTILGILTIKALEAILALARK